MKRLIAIAVLCALPAFAQQPAASERIEVQVTSIDVVVTDAQGKFVHGLTKDDFIVLDDGKPQPLTNFAEYSGESEPAPQQTTAAAAPAAPPPARPTVTVLIFVDHLHLRPATRAHAIAAISRFVAANAGNPITWMLGSFDGSLHLHPAVSAGEVRQDLDSGSRTAISSLEMERERRQVLEHVQTVTDPQMVYRELLTYAEMERRRMQETMAAVDDAVAALAGVEGPKRMLYISDGLPQAAAPEMFQYYERRFHTNVALDAMSYDASRFWEKIAAHANAAGVTMYMLQAGGGGAQELSSAETSTFETKIDPGTLRENNIGVLKYLAEETGGRAITDTNQLDAPLGGIASDLLNYYSLGYRTPAPANASHSIAVRMQRPGLTVRYRRAYKIRTPDEALSDAVQAMLYQPRNDNPLNAHLSIGHPKKEGRGKWQVPMILSIPKESILLNGTMTAFLAVMDSGGTHTNVRRLTAPIREHTDVRQTLNLTLGSGEQILALAVRDDATSQTSFLRLTLTPDR